MKVTAPWLPAMAEAYGAMGGRSPDFMRHSSCPHPSPLRLVNWPWSKYRRRRRSGDEDSDRLEAEAFIEGCRPASDGGKTTAGARLRELWRRAVKGRRRIGLMRSASTAAPPPRRYDPYTYAQNFDDGFTAVDPDFLWRSFSAKYAGRRPGKRQTAAVS